MTVSGVSGDENEAEKAPPEQVITKLRKADELLAQGKSAEYAAKALAVTVTTY